MAMWLHKILIGCLALGMLVSCAGSPSLDQDTPTKSYNAAYEQVYTASINAFQNLGLEVFKTDEQAGYIEGGRKPAFGQGSETVGIFLDRTSPTTTSVQIDNNRAMLGYLFSKDWTDELFNQIGSELGE